MTFEEVFEQIKKLFQGADVKHITEHVAFQFNIEGEAEGVFYAEVKDGCLRIEPYDYQDRDVLLRAKAKTFLDIAKGKTDPVMAFTLGKLKVEGDLGKALMIKEFISA